MAHPAWTDEFLDGMRLIGDEPADQLVKELITKQQVGAVNLMMRKLVENEGIPPGSIPDGLREFLQSSAVLPQWTDMEKVRLAENLFWLHGPAIVLLLFCYSLPFCYAARKEVQALLEGDWPYSWAAGRADAFCLELNRFPLTVCYSFRCN
jgi:hypothetical protein